MKQNVLPDVVRTGWWRCMPCRHATAVLILATLCLCALALPARADKPIDARGEARIVIIADTRSTSPADEISLRLMNNSDQGLLTALVRSLGEKFGMQPAAPQYFTGDDNDASDKSAAVKFYASIVPRGEGYLPIAPFVEAFAPYASRLRILYIIKGPFVYRGYQTPYQDRDVAFSVDLPKSLAQNPNEPLAFYGIDVNIKNPTLTTLTLPKYPEEERQRRLISRKRVALAAGVALAIIALGLFLSQLLPLRKKGGSEQKDSPAESDTLTGGNHD